MADPKRKPVGPGAQQQEPEPLPGVVVGDEVYFRHHLGPTSGRVVCHGKHGATIEMAGGQQHRVKWQHVLAHKKRAAQTYKIEDEGEDGMIVVDDAGGRHFIGIPPEAREDRMMVKSMGGSRLILLKAAPGGAGIPPGPGLTRKQLVDKNGVQTTRWVNNTPDAPPADVGHHVGFVNGEHKGHGRVMASGPRGVTVQDGSGGVHRVEHGNVTHRWEGGGAPPGSPHQAPEQQQQQQQQQQQAAGGKPEIKPHEGDPDTFNAASFAAQHDDPNATADSIIAGFGDDAHDRIEKAKARLGNITQTIDEHSKNGVWNEKRAELHRKIIFDGVEVKGKKVPGLLHPDRIKAATPQPGEKPTFIALGGRGGSGKSSLDGRVYDASRAIVLDADHIKGLLPEYAGWNAHQVHEESSHVLETVLAMAKILGVNVVLDATMKTGKSIEEKVDDFKSHGFRIEAHYMHLPRQEAAKRAIGRFLNGGETGRFVPPEVVLGNTKNEANFDAIKQKADAWTFHDNSGEKGSGPKLIASKGSPQTVAKKILLKSERPGIVMIFNRRVK